MRWMWWFFAVATVLVAISALFVPGGNLALWVVWTVALGFLVHDQIRQFRWERRQRW